MFGLFFECFDKLKIKSLREGCLELWKVVKYWFGVFEKLKYEGEN